MKTGDPWAPAPSPWRGDLHPVVPGACLPKSALRHRGGSSVLLCGPVFRDNVVLSEGGIIFKKGAPQGTITHHGLTEAFLEEAGFQLQSEKCRGMIWAERKTREELWAGLGCAEALRQCVTEGDRVG